MIRVPVGKGSSSHELWGSKSSKSYYRCSNARVEFTMEEIPKVVQTTSQPGFWSCPICTYANDEGLSACDICGVLRDPVVSNNGDNKKSASFKVDSVLQEDLVKFGKHSAMKSTQGNSVELSLPRASSGSSQKKKKINKLPSKNMLKTPSASVPEIGQPSSYERNGFSLDDDNLQTLNNSFNKVKASADSGSSRNRVSTQKTKSVPPYKPEKWMLPDQEGKLTQLNLAIFVGVSNGCTVDDSVTVNLPMSQTRISCSNCRPGMVVERMDSDLWDLVLNPENEYRRQLIDQVISTALPESKSLVRASFCSSRSFLDS